jgi:DNA-binding transcriptional MerR regulator
MDCETAQAPDRLGVTATRKLYGVTCRALRYYEEVGLVTAHRNSHNLRCYDRAARLRLRWITRLKRFVALQDIAEVLRVEEKEPGKGRVIALRHLDRRRVMLEDELAALQAAVADMLTDGQSNPAGLREHRAS